MDVLSAPTEPQALTGASISRGGAMLAKDADTIATALANAKRPLLIIGDEAFWELNHDLDAGKLRAAVERHGFLFSSLRHGRGVIDERHDQYCGLGCVYANATLRKAMNEADLIFLLGHQMESDLEFGHHVSEGCVIVQAYPDTAYHGKGYKSDIVTTAGVATLTDFLLDLGPVDYDTTWAKELATAWRAERSEEIKAETGATPLHPAVVVDTVVGAMPEDTIFACGAGNVDFWVDERIQVRAPGSYLKGGLGGGLGADIPYALGANTARPDRPALVFVGDGGLGYHGFEIDTASRYDRPIIVVVMDDQKWGCIAVPQEANYGAEFEMDLPERDWPGFARSLGAFGIRAETESELREALSAAVQSRTPALIHVPVRTVLSPFMAYVGY
jgi:acetolactate synthase-1/2/3 large subunit